ncbi:MAG TPA: sensor histidine kinase [Isosphaeraceae bacterium]|nr:sensor histidine kinase [Isosphaeraceae bacterium]
MDQDQLAQALEQLADQGHLSAGVGHHVINAFSAIVSNCEILRLTANTASALDPAVVADMIVRTSLEASGVARRLIDYTRSATNVGTGTLLLHELLAHLIERERQNRRPEITWEANLNPVPPIAGQELQIVAMMKHLITNSCEAMSGREGSISISTVQDNRGWVALEIRDNGNGMDAPTLERAVEPFFTTKPGHFGVGLSIANGIWRRHHGTLALRSQPGEGTFVRLCVEPAKEEKPAPTRSQARSASKT